jgi:tetratricopeptide (TPR) repeat protein
MLAGTASFEHTDDEPALEFQAARSMLIPFTVDTVFDSLLRLKMASGDSSPAGLTWSVGPGAWRAAYARALPADQPEALRSAELALEAAPRDPERQAVLGRVLFERQEYPAAAAHLDSALAAGDRDPGLLLTAALAQVRLEDLPRAKVLLERVRASGGDSSFAAAVLAEIAANAGDYGTAATEATRAIAGLRPTAATPFPGALDGALTRLANQAPPAQAGPVFERAVVARPSWQLAYWGGAVVNARAGGAACVRAERFALGLERFAWTDAEIGSLVRRCPPQSRR